VSTRQPTPVRCKRLIQQALDATKEALEKFETASRHSQKHNKLTSSSLSILENDWMGAQALKAVCLMRMEKLQRNLALQQQSTKTTTLSKIRTPSLYSSSKQPPPPPPPPRSSLTTPTKSFLCKTSRTPSPRVTEPADPPSLQQTFSHEPVLDSILDRLELVRNPDLSRNVFYNHDILGGRAGALQLIWWLRQELGKDNATNETWAQDIVVSITCDMIQQGLATAEELRQQQHTHELPPLPPDTLFWVCDSHGTRKPYLHASRGVVGILYTLLGLHTDDWSLVEEEIPNARQYLRNTVDLFCAYGNRDEVNEATSPTREQNENDCANSNIYNELPANCGDDEKEMTNPKTMSEKPFGILSRHGRVRAQEDAEKQLQMVNFQKRIFFEAGNLRPFLDAPNVHDLSVDWFQGAAGLGILLLRASRVFQSKAYLIAAHTVCDSVILQRGMDSNSENQLSAAMETNSRLAWRSNSSHHRRTLYNLSPLNDNNHNNTESSYHDRTSLHNKYKSKGPAGMASMALCFLMLSEQCSGDTIVQSKNVTTLSLQSMWKNRALYYAQHAEKEWMSHLETVPITTGGWNPFSLYEGMGCLVSLLWQLARSKQPCEDESFGEFQLPFCISGSPTCYTDKQKIEISFNDVKILPPKEQETLPQSPPHIRRTTLPKQSPQSSPQNSAALPVVTEKEKADAELRRKLAEEKLAESRKRRAKAEREALRRKAIEEAAKKKKLEEEKERKALEEKKRKANLEARKHLQVVSRKMAAIKIEEDDNRNEEELSKKMLTEESKREAMLLARKQAQERVEAQRKAKEKKEKQRAEELEKMRKADLASKQAKAEAEANKRKEMADQLLKAKKEEAKLAKERERQRVLKEREESKRKQEELQRLDDERKKRDEERQRRMTQVWAQQEALKKRKEEEQLKLKIEQEEQRRLKERQKLLAAEEQWKRREELLKKKTAAEMQRAREKAKKEKELEEFKFKKQLEKALKLEEDRQKLREKQKRREEAQARRWREELVKKEKAEKERLKRIAETNRKKEEERKKRLGNTNRSKLQEGTQNIPLRGQHVQTNIENTIMTSPEDKSPSKETPFTSKVSQQRDAVSLSRYSLPSRPSMFWSLQSDSKIGASDDYSIALVIETDAATRNGESVSVASSSQIVSSKTSDLSCDNSCSESTRSPCQAVQLSQCTAANTSWNTEVSLVGTSIPRRRKGIDPTQRIHSLSKIVQGTLELRKQL
jgi:hypothetical protein